MASEARYANLEAGKTIGKASPSKIQMRKKKSVYPTNLLPHFLIVALLLLGLSKLAEPPTPHLLGVTSPCPHIDIDQAYKNSDLVITGKVFAVVPSVHGAEVLVTPERIFRGTFVDPTIRLAAVAETPGKHQLVLNPAVIHLSSASPTYIFFLRQHPDGLYTTSRCDGTRPLTDGFSPAEAAALGAGFAVHTQTQ